MAKDFNYTISVEENEQKCIKLLLKNSEIILIIHNF
jgi:hypothetical protein